MTRRPAPGRAQLAVAKLLVEREDGRLVVRDGDLDKVEAIIEVAACVADERGEHALLDIVRLAMALDAAGHAAGRKQLFDALKRSPAAMNRLAEALKKDAKAHQVFRQFTDEAAPSRAPRYDAQEPSGAVPLRTLLRPDAGRRLEPRARPTGRKRRVDNR